MFGKRDQFGVSMGLVIVLVAVLLGAASVYYVFTRTQELKQVADQETMATLQSETMSSRAEAEMQPAAVAPSVMAPSMSDPAASEPATSEPMAAPKALTAPKAQPTPEPTSVFSGQVLAGQPSPLLDFNQADYDAALYSGRLVVLYFYANWCPICQEETRDALYPAFNNLADSDIVGFRVNYNDNQTSDEERAVAREHGVAYQHTKVFIRNGERLLKSPEAWTLERYQSEFINHR